MYRLSLGLLGFLSFFVFIEPAPFDLVFAACLTIGAASLGFRWGRDTGFAVACVAIFLLSNLVAFLYPGLQDVERGAYFCFISAYLAAALPYFAHGDGREQAANFHMFMLGCAGGALLTIASSALILTGGIDTPGFTPWGQGRLQGFFKDPNVFGPSLVVVLLYGASRFGSAPGKLPRWFWLCAAIASAVGLLLSFSRAAWLNAAVAIAAYMLLAPRDRTQKMFWLKAVACFFAALCAIALALWQFEDMRSLFLTRLAFQEYDQDRFANQGIAFQSFLEAPIGIGPGQSEIELNYATHNLFARLMFENGLLGFLAIGALLTGAFWRAMRAVAAGTTGHVASIVAAVLLGIAANSLFIDSLHWRHFWIFLGFAYGLPLARRAQSATFARDGSFAEAWR
jgi:O-antigen ligase